MWIVTKLGFMSAVRHRTLKHCLMVRARRRVDLDSLVAEATRSMPRPVIEHTIHADYPYRVTVHQNVLARWLSQQAQDIDYDNFKAACPDDRHGAYMGVWSALHRLEEPRIRHRQIVGEVQHEIAPWDEPFDPGADDECDEEQQRRCDEAVYDPDEGSAAYDGDEENPI